MRPLLRLLKKSSRLLAAGLAASAVLLLLVVGIGPRTGRYQFQTVLTGSMRPNMPEGSVVLSTPVDVGQLAVGDVITYRIPVEDRRVVTHRVIEVLEPGVVRTQGDANKDPDTWIAKLQGQKVWQARASAAKVGYALERLRKPQTSKLLVLAVPFLLAFLWLRDIWTREEGVAVPPVSTATRVQGAVALAALLSLGAARVRDRA